MWEKALYHLGWETRWDSRSFKQWQQIQAEWFLHMLNRVSTSEIAMSSPWCGIGGVSKKKLFQWLRKLRWSLHFELGLNQFLPPPNRLTSGWAQVVRSMSAGWGEGENKSKAEFHRLGQRCVHVEVLGRMWGNAYASSIREIFSPHCEYSEVKGSALEMDMLLLFSC